MAHIPFVEGVEDDGGVNKSGDQSTGQKNKKRGTGYARLHEVAK
jgi:hypothetical protein